MTMKKGFAWGLLAGLGSWLLLNSYIVYAPAPESARNLVASVASVMFILSVVVAIVGILRGKSSLGTTTDGFIYGFTAVFDVLYILRELQLGYLPLP